MGYTRSITVLKFTFKKQPKETGLRAVGTPYPDTDIKVNKKAVGYISAPNWQTKTIAWKIRLAVKKEITTDDPAGFKWVSAKKVFGSEADARQWIKENTEELSNLDLYYFED